MAAAFMIATMWMPTCFFRDYNVLLFWFSSLIKSFGSICSTVVMALFDLPLMRRVIRNFQTSCRSLSRYHRAGIALAFNPKPLSPEPSNTLNPR